MILHQSFNLKDKDTTSKLGKNSFYFIKITASVIYKVWFCLILSTNHSALNIHIQRGNAFCETQ